MKTTLLLLASLVCLNAAEQSRTWTDIKGRSITGQLVAKTSDSAGIILASGKRADLKLETLSEPDREYVAAADVAPVARMLAKTVASKSNANGTGRDERQVSVSVSETNGRALKLRLVWIGDTGDKNNYGVAKTDLVDVTADGAVEFNFRFGTTAVYSKNYKGYAVELTDKDGVAVARQGSIQPLTRFLDK